MSKLKIIYFIDGFAPTADEELEAQSFGVKTVFRNAQYVTCADEACDGVAGSVIPDAYKDYPRADEIVADQQAAAAEAKKRLAERVAGVSDTPPNETPQGEAANPSAAWGKNQ